MPPVVGKGALVAAPAGVEGIDAIIARKRASAAARSKRSRARRRAHCAVYDITITDTTLDVLVKRWHWLSEAQSMDRREIERAVSEGLAEAAAAEKI